ncbi:hypothetical protein [uncultured Mesotoga sp.]|uniref:hypothetical protein n=1 Tax=uncultured Mesotoga sp. TaxID=1184400 RepID=UPI002592E1E8|nr:hypothetical protein [uncultured Mesotoga sp.]
MYNKSLIDSLSMFVRSKDGINDKSELSTIVKSTFSLTEDRSVYYCEDFAIRFCKTRSSSFSNTVLSLSALQKYDDRPFIVCAVSPTKNFLFLANTTCLKKISHSSQELRTDNIRGSFNGSDILRSIEGTENCPEGFEDLFLLHQNFSFEENLQRLVESTGRIVPTGSRFEPDQMELKIIFDAPIRTVDFASSVDYDTLNQELADRVSSVKCAILVAAYIENVNIRGRVIEYLITADEEGKKPLLNALLKKEALPEIRTANQLGDYTRSFSRFDTETDIKTKVMFLSSAPKAYNIDKFLQFISRMKSVYMIYVVAVDNTQSIRTRLCSPFNTQILEGTRVIHHWAGRNSRGVTQYTGDCLKQVVNKFNNSIDVAKSRDFLEELLGCRDL